MTRLMDVFAWGVNAAVLRDLSRALPPRCLRIHEIGEDDLLVSQSRSDYGYRVLLVGGVARARAFDAIASLREREHALPVILCLGIGEPELRHLPAYVRAGIDEVVLANGDRADKTLADHVRNYLEYNLREDCLQVMLAQAGALKGEMSCIARRSFRPIRVETVARRLEVSSSTLRRRHQKGPIGLFRWMQMCRWLHIAHQLDATMDPISVIARRLQFPSPGDLSMFVSRIAGASPRELREVGAVRTAMAAICARLREGRSNL